MNKVIYPYVARINAHEVVVFSASEIQPPECAFCFRSRVETTRVASGGRRIDAVYSREYVGGRDVGTLPGQPICWSCIREKTLAGLASSSQWRMAIARFLNALNASDPKSLYCEIKSLG
jgi:hypothetical protein